jgi:competence protein ComEC
MVLPFWSAALATGIAAGIWTPPATALLLSGLLFAAGTALAMMRRVVLVGVALALGAGLLLARHAAAPIRLSPALELAARGDREVWILAQWVRTLHFDRGPDRPGERALLDLLSVDGRSERARLTFTLPPGGPRFLPGDRVRFRGRLAEPSAPANPGAPDPGTWRRNSGVDLLVSVVRGEPVRLEQRGYRFAPRRLAHEAHLALAAAIAAAVTGREGRLLRALVLGERLAVEADTEAGFRAAGALHVLSVSGLHLTAIAGFLFLVLRKLILFFPVLALRLRPELIAGLVCLPAMGFYTLLTGEAVATVRAALMGGLALAAVLMRRPPSVANAIACAAALLLLSSPLLLLDVSFQLSFAGVISLAVSAAARRRDGGEETSRGGAAKAGRWLARAVWASGAAMIVTVPLCAHHFAEIAPAALVGNLLLVPPLELGALPLGLLGSALGAGHPVLGLVPLRLAGWLSAFSLWLADGFRRLAPVISVMSPNLMETLLFLAGALLLVIAAGRPPRPRLLLGAGLAFVVGAGAMGIRVLARRLDPNMRITFLDVGQGDAALVEAPGGFVMLVDAGGGVYPGSFDPGARVVGPVLRRKGIERIDLVVLSHPHPDHMNGLFHVFEHFQVGTLWTPGEAGGNPEYDRLIALARARGVEVAEPRSFVRGPLEVQARGPMLGASVRAPPGLGVNDASLVVRLGFAGRWFLFPGDIENQGEMELVAASEVDPLQSDVLKVPHHGSRTSSGAPLLDAVAPGIAVVSLGRRNRFGFPRAEVLARYASRGIKVLRTDLHGAVTLEVEKGGALQITCTRPCR